VSAFIENFGEAGEAASWTSHSDLAMKIDRYLSRPALRQEIGDAIRAEIAARHTLPDVLRHVLEAVEGMRARLPSPGMTPVAITGPAVGVSEGTPLLPRWRTHAHWFGATLSPHPDGLALLCGPDAWSYAAELPLTAAEAGSGRLMLGLCVEAGRVAVTVVPADRQNVVLYEVLVGLSSPVAVEIEIPLAWSTDLSVILRDAATGGSRGVLHASRLVAAMVGD